MLRHEGFLEACTDQTLFEIAGNLKFIVKFISEILPALGNLAFVPWKMKESR